MYVRQWMTSPAFTLPASTPALDALEQMTVRNITRVPVVLDGILVGLATRNDLQTDLLGRSVQHRPRVLLQDVMRRPVHSVASGDTLEEACQKLLVNRISGLPVVDGLRIVGIITESDIFRAFTRVMGIPLRGVRLTLKLAAGSDPFEELSRRLHGLRFRSLVLIESEDDTWDAILRICGRAPAPSNAGGAAALQDSNAT